MNLFISKLNKNLDNQLQIINLEENDVLIKSQKSVQSIKKALTDLKVFVLEYSFADECKI